ncbi:diguanylate cyclase [Pseudomonas sp. NPDC078863]|jgi:diguanylate cyclase (GGDEF)-like protein|uniref:sensor domain-containing diguanylate cyclase n=1 Tax=unclassified Pseudomonas TaxID=196821 RepID=UPI0028B115D0|nr:sensor domain-containing diguanylate cyclase [Pseudomonas sp.]
MIDRTDTPQESVSEETLAARQPAVALNLRGLILSLVLLSVLATLGNSLVTAYRVQRDALIDHALQSNSAYAAKVASSLSEFIHSAQNHLRYSASELGKAWGDANVMSAEAVRLQKQDADFNSIAVIDRNAKVLKAYPDTLQINGSTLSSDAIRKAIEAQRPFISPAYPSSAGNLVVFISQPVYDAAERYVGIIGGSVYLREDNALHTLISRHFQHEGTFVFVTDQDRQLLFHPDAARIGDTLGWSKTADAALRGESGSMTVRNYKGVAMLAGYAQVPGAGWAVVAQQPREVSLAPMNTLMRDVFEGMVPAALIGFVLIWFGTSLVCRPLNQLSRIARQLSAPQATEQLRHVKAWYQEAFSIRQAMLAGVQLLQAKLGRLNQQVLTDPMTGLANRRAMDEELRGLERAGRTYSVLSLDIDHFKRVNDTFGHDKGDLAIKQVAHTLQTHSRTGDLACRAGGEEFLLILPETDVASASVIAERIRQAIATSDIETVGHITASIGVATCEHLPTTAEIVLKKADECLYRAKQGGRNRVESHLSLPSGTCE